jgi:hypothetical protein
VANPQPAARRGPGGKAPHVDGDEVGTPPLIARQGIREGVNQPFTNFYFLLPGGRRMNKQRKRIFLSTAAFLATLLSVSFYRSKIDGVAFSLAFDRVAKTMTFSLWQLITNPIILTALALLFVLYLGGPHLPKLLYFVKEIRAGIFTATLHEGRLSAHLGQEGNLPETGGEGRQIQVRPPQAGEERPPASGKITDAAQTSESQRALVRRLMIPFCWYLLKVANKEMIGDEHIRIMSSEYFSHFLKDEKWYESREGRQQLELLMQLFLLGAFQSGSALFQIALNKEDEGKNLPLQRIMVRITPDVLDLIKERVVERGAKPDGDDHSKIAT